MVRTLVVVAAVLASVSAQAHSMKSRIDRDGSSNNLVYYGGPVLSHVKVSIVYWGSDVDPQTVAGMGGFFKMVTSSSMLDWLNRYNTNIKAQDGREGTHQQIGRGSVTGEFTIQPHNTAAQMTNNQVAAELETQIGEGKLPTPDSDMIYMVYFPKGIILTLDDGSQSCQAWCADHEGFRSSKVGSFAYAMMPDIGSGTGCDIGCGYGDSPLSSLGVISSHELVEAITDPLCPPMGQPNAYPAGWVNPSQQEIGDLCAGEPYTKISSSSATYEVQQEWDNSTGACSTGPWTAAIE